jgi:hypothetical protein
MSSTNIEDYKNCIFLINELYPNYNNNPYDEFNYKIPSKENSLNSLDTSITSIDINEEEEKKYIPSTLFDYSRNRSKIIEGKDNVVFIQKKDSKIFVNDLDLNSKPFFPKTFSQINNKNINQNNILASQQNKNIDNSNNEWNECKKKKNKKKKNFNVKKGDWVCYDCKNINFSFRDKCNRCKLNKEESEQKYIDAGKNILSKLNDNNLEVSILEV